MIRSIGTATIFAERELVIGVRPHGSFILAGLKAFLLDNTIQGRL
ncbi:MAG: hypothetical protein ABID54_11940 [Pseudomonadota bacterium]